MRLRHLVSGALRAILQYFAIRGGGKPSDPKVTIVGKGVCFDSGGLDLKPPTGMKLMKKDMGGAATTLGLARMIMMAGLPVRLRVLVPAVENSVSGNAFRPLDVLHSRAGITVEIGEVLKVWTTLIANCRARLIALPTALTPTIQAARDEHEITEILTDGINDALDELDHDGLRG